MKKLLLLSIIIAFFGTFIVSAQQQSCGSIFTDQAGISANYANNSNLTTTFCPTNPGEVVTVNFTSFATEQNWDFLKIYDGNTVSSTLIGSFSGTINPGSLTASSASGCLTFVFTSDGVGTAAGWEASISCGLPSTCPKPLSVSVTNATSEFSLSNPIDLLMITDGGSQRLYRCNSNSTGQIKITQFDGVTMSGEFSFSNLKEMQNYSTIPYINITDGVFTNIPKKN